MWSDLRTRTLLSILVLFSVTSVLVSCGGGHPSGTQDSGAATAEFVFIADNAAQPVIRTFKLDSQSGVLTEVGSPAPAAWVRPLVVDPKGRFLYTGPVQTTASGIWAYTISSTTGQLTAVPGSPFPGPWPHSSDMAIETGGKFLYYDGEAFAIDQNTGALTRLQNFTSPNGSFVITRDDLMLSFFCPAPGSSGTLSSYGIDTSTGDLNPLKSTSVLCDSSAGAGLLIDPTGKFVYVSASILLLDPKTGAFTPSSGSVPAVGPPGAGFDPQGRFLYVSDFQNVNALDAFAIDATAGTLIPVPGSPFPIQVGLGTFAVEPTGKFLIASPESTYAIDPNTGALTAVQGPVLHNATALSFYR